MPMNALDVIRFDLQEAAEGLNRLIGSPEVLENISRAADLIVEAQKAGGKVLSCGNGGSLCDAMHFAEEMTGRFRNDRPPYAASRLRCSHRAARPQPMAADCGAGAGI